MRSEPSSFTAAPPRVVAVLCACLAGLPAARVDAAADVSYDRLDALLARHVRDGLVDYAALKTDPGFARWTEGLSVVDPDRLSSRDERLAFWINAYNTLVLKGVVDHYPIRSVSDVGPAGKWTFFRSLEFPVGGRRLTLDRIEHRIIRATFEDPRVHFALVCASRGCPMLPSRAFHPDSLQADLDAAARRFINDPRKVRLDRERRVLYLSPIFDWYKADFVKASGSVTRFIARYLDGGLPDAVRTESLDYSWALNAIEETTR